MTRKISLVALTALLSACTATRTSIEASVKEPQPMSIPLETLTLMDIEKLRWSGEDLPLAVEECPRPGGSFFWIFNIMERGNQKIYRILVFKAGSLYMFEERPPQEITFQASNTVQSPTVVLSLSWWDNEKRIPTGTAFFEIPDEEVELYEPCAPLPQKEER